LDALSSGARKDTEVEVEDRILSLTFAPVVDADYLNVYGLDITGRVRAEEALEEHSERLEVMVEQRTAELRESEEKLRAQYKGIPVPTYTWQGVEDDFVLVDYNDAAVEITQGKIADLVGIKASEMYRDTPRILEELSRCVAEKVSIEREMSYRFRSTGEIRDLAVKYAFVPPGLVLVHTEDITERQRPNCD
jgi:PAS domain-containing protein